MYYQNYDDYMRDVFYFNQMPNQNMNYPCMGCNVQNQNFQANSVNSNFNNGNSNLNNMYPSIYRIVQPVVSRVVTGNNYQFMSEDNLNSMVDTVYNIVEGDVMANTGESSDPNNNNVSTQTQNQTQRSNSSNNQPSSTAVSNASNNASSRVNDNNQHSRNLLRDLIRILLIKEILNRNNIRRFANNSFNNFQNMPNYSGYMF